jgi:HD-GYP domain-containing protein (c-di-GMP phosphodiesterase class II)
VSTQTHKPVDLERYGRLLRSAAGAAFPVAFSAGAGAPMWLAEGSAESGIEAALQELEGFEETAPEAGGARRMDAGRGRCLLYARVCSNPQQEPGRLAVMLDADLPTERLAAVERALVDVAACVEGQLAMYREADGLAREVSTRYEELNLLYSLGGLTDSFALGKEGAKGLLRTLVEGLDIDLAVFATSAHSAPIYVVNPSQEISNLDLVLTAIRGTLFRFATIDRKPLILNAFDDPRRQFLFVNMPYLVLACPVVGSRDMSAMLVLVRVQGRPEFTNGDRNLGMVIANQVAIMLQNQEMIGSLQSFGEEAIAALISAIESKDPYTRGHSERVQKIAVKLGVAADLDSITLEDISWGSLLHDVGKIGIPENIICKAGSLTDDEYTMVKTHPERSYEILRNIGQLRRGALEAARHHHERYDGTGYPQRLRGKAIPLESRVIAIADTYDAITSSRSYRAGMDHGATMQEIRRVAGSQLDGDLVQLFDNLCERNAAWVKGLEARDGIGDG